jgi:hypothetical protein
MRTRSGRLARVVLAVLSLLLLAAHFYRGGIYPLVVASISLTALAFVAQRWAGRVLGALLLAGALEWLRTAWVFASLRASMGLPYARLVAILGSVAAFTLASAWLAWRGAGAQSETD